MLSIDLSGRARATPILKLLPAAVLASALAACSPGPEAAVGTETAAGPAGNFDFEGVAGREVKLVEAGVLRDGLYDLEYAKKCGTRASGLATGNLRDRFQTEPIRIPRGSQKLDALIQDAGRGILIQHCSEMSRTTNLRGDFSCGLDALLFEDGQIRGRIKNLNMSGNVFTLLRDGLTAMSGDGESSSTLGVIAPHLLIEGIRFTA